MALLSRKKHHISNEKHRFDPMYLFFRLKSYMALLSHQNTMSKITKITKETKEFDTEDRRLLIVDLLRQQRQSFKGEREDFIQEHCTLIDLSTGVIVGSGICGECNGFMGRLDQ